MRAVPGVKDVRDLHVWAIGPRQPGLSAHVEVDETSATTLRALREALHDLGIAHSTLQLEAGPCGDHEDCIPGA
jgi:cobalt-zinc-cadmium efflux system protein